MERRNRRTSHGSSLHETMEERSLLRECALVPFRRDEEMEAPISASQGAMLSLPGKLASLLLEPPGHGLTKGEKNKIHLLKGDLEELIANYLMEPSEVDAPALTANCWVKEVRELSYDIDDFFKELIHVDADAIIDAVQKTPRVMITRLRENLNRRRWIADEISGFRNRVKGAIKLHSNYNLGSCSFRSWRTTDEHPLPPLYARLVHRGDLWDKLHGWLTDDREQQKRVASIVGIGGVGKTTLAKQVYDKLGGRFERRAFVRTSRKADMRRLLTSMLSQLRRHEPPEADAVWEVHHLIDKIRAHLIHKKYFIIIDDLWSTSTWDIVSHALPDNPCSRILLTTEFDIVAQICCGYNSKYIFKMEPLSENGSRELFFSRAFGHQHDCPEQLNEVSYEIIRKCGGLPLATITIASLLACQQNRIDQWKYIQNSLSSILRTDATLEWMQQVLNVSYNNLPHRLKACMLYLSMYQESHIIWKHDLVKQWIAEDFISVVEGEDMEEIAGSYFDELVKRGMIQPVDINYNGEVLSCAMHYIVHNFIRYKSIEENFVCAIDHSQTNVRLTNKVRRLSLHFGDAEDVTPPSLRLSQVRSVGFFGLFKCMPSILEFNLLQVLILQLWVDDYDMSYNFTEISKLFRLRYLRINAFHLSVQLPAQMQRLKDLVTLDIERRVTAVPSDIVDLPRLLHLSLPSETALPNSIGRMTSLRTLGYFNLSSNSKDNVLNLGKLTNLCDLRLTCSTVPSDNLEDNMQCLSTILWKLSRLKSLTLAPEFSHTKTTDASVSRMSISCDGLGSVPSPPTLLQRLELLPRICIFSSLPEWIRKLDRLSILRIAVRGLSMNDIDILKGLLALTALSLFVRTAPVERIVFDKAGFPILKYLKFMCTAPCLAFEEGAMPTVRRLKLGSNAHRAEQYGPVLSSIKYLLNLEEITVLICGSDRTAAKPVLWDAITKHLSTPIINIRYVDWIFCCEEENIRATQKQEQPSSENQYENVEVDSDRQHGILEMNTGKDTTQEQEQPSLENRYENVEVDSDRQHGILEMNTGKDTTQEQEQPSLENQYENVEVDSDRQHGILEMNMGKDKNNQADCRISMSPESSSHLPSPEKKSAGDTDLIGGSDQRVKESGLKSKTGKHPNTPTVKSSETQGQEYLTPEKQDENLEEDTNKQHVVREMKPGKYTDEHADSRISKSSESSSHLPNPDGHATIDIEETYETKLPSTATLAKSQNVMGEIVIFLAIKKISIALGNEATQQASAQFAKYVTQLREIQGRMGRVMTELRVMHDFLCQMDIRNRNNQVYEGWLEEVRKVAYVIEDMVDEYLYLVGQEHDVGWRFYLKKGFKQPKAVLSLNRIASMVKETEAKLIHLSQTKERWFPTINNGDTTNSSYIVQKSQDLASISRFLGEEDLVGVEDNKQTLVQWLGDYELARSVIVLHGMGGLGKTALAATVYKEEREKFDCHAWVSISQTYTKEDVLRILIVELFRDKHNVPSNIATMDTTTMQETLNMFLEQKKYLVTLDDVWTPEAWNDLFGALPSNLKGSRIIITTRIANVAHLAFPDKILTLEPLSEDESWELFCNKAFPDRECPAELQTLSEQIVGRCEGLPLAIVSIGSLLFVRDKTVDEWKRIHDRLSWEIINNPRLDHVRNVLLLSFIYLPTYLKSCFLYCSLFPEDYLFRRKKLVRLWIAEGFIENRGQSTIEEVAEGYLKELVHINMLQLIERNHFGRIKSFRMHGIVRELAIDLCRRECFGVAYKEDESLEEDERRLVIHELKKGSIPEPISSARHLRSVITLDSSMPSSTLLPLIAEKCRYILVLELSGLPIEKVPDAIGDLFNLRHLGLRGSKVKHLPKSIEKLSNLLTLDLSRSDIQELPRGITKLKKLRHLFAEKWIDSSARSFRWGTGVCIPKGLENLTDLQTLRGLEAQDESVRHLGELKQLRSIRIWNVKGIYCEHLCKSLVQMQFLSYLSITACDEDEAIQLNGLNPPPPSLQRIVLRGRLAEGTLESPLFQTARQKLFSLALSWSQLREDPLPCLSRLSNLTDLRLTRAYSKEQLAFLTGWFPKLKSLYLRDLPNLKHLKIQQGAMASLETFTLVNLRSMTEVPTGIEFLMPLQFLGFREISPEFLTSLHGSRIGGMSWLYTLRD